MDFFEKIFQSGANFWKRKKIAQEIARGASFEEYFQSVSLLARAAAGDAILDLRAVDGQGYIQGEVLALPSRISRFSSSELNRALLFQQALFGGALRALEISGRPDAAFSDTISYLSEIFPAFLPRYEEVRKMLGAELGQESGGQELVWVSVPWHAALSKDKRAFDQSASQRKRNQDQSEREAKRPGNVEAIDLDKQRKENNPVTHSFEKMETADEYRGGHRVTDASDELDSHASALDELNLNKVTRSGENAQSVYRAEVSDLFESEETGLSNSRAENFLWYPEWDYKKRELKPRHCRLYARPAAKALVEGPWRAELESLYSADLLRWEQQWLGIVNQRSWRSRQWDGEELDVDAYVRYLADLRSSGMGDNRVFAKRLPSLRDISTLIVLDQSYSTDAFVEGRRVLDVELESIGLAGLLMDKLKEQVAVAGCWSETRSHCYFQWHKEFSDPWKSFFSQAPAIEPLGYTRLGPAIRHAANILWKTGAPTKLLILLTDGKPTDYDRYEGRYGIEDIHHSILEARQLGVEVKALAVEKDARHYFPALFGQRNFQILSSPRQLPEALFRLYLEAILR